MLDELIRKMVREEVAAALQLLKPLIDGSRNPFALNDVELVQAEKLLPEVEAAALRLRVMAYRLEKAGRRSSAERMRVRANKMTEAA